MNEPLPTDTPIPSVTPERWETAVEDIAQVVAIGLDRAQDLFDIIGEVNRAKPGLLALVAAGLGGALAGGFLARRLRERQARRSRTRDAFAAARRAASERLATMDLTRSGAQQALDQSIGKSGVSAALLRERVQRLNRVPRPDVSVSSAAKLVPLMVALMRNPLVRDLILQLLLRPRRRR
jgi:hypothetical protein